MMAAPGYEHRAPPTAPQLRGRGFREERPSEAMSDAASELREGRKGNTAGCRHGVGNAESWAPPVCAGPMVAWCCLSRLSSSATVPEPELDTVRCGCPVALERVQHTVPEERLSQRFSL